MKIVVMINGIYFRSRVLYKVLLKNQKHEFLVFSVANSDKKTKNIESIKKKVSFWGLKGTAFLTASTIWDKIASKLNLTTYDAYMSGLERVANEFNAEYRFTTNVNSEETLNAIKNFEPDVIVSFQHQIFKERLLRLPKVACINCHSSVLPAYRGLKPVFWAMLDGSSEIGVTVHTMAKEIDMGRIVAQRKIELDKTKSYLQNATMLNELSADVINEGLALLESKSIEDFPLIPNDAKYYGYPSRDQIRLFLERGNKLI